MPVVGAAAVTGGAAIVSGLFGSHATKSAADTQAAGTAAALAEQKRVFDIKQAQAAPYIKSGADALGRLNDMTKYQVHQTLPPAYGPGAAYNAPVPTWQQQQSSAGAPPTPAPAPPTPAPAPQPGPGGPTPQDPNTPQASSQPQGAPQEPMGQFQAPTGQVGTFPIRMSAQLVARGARRIS